MQDHSDRPSSDTRLPPAEGGEPLYRAKSEGLPPAEGGEPLYRAKSEGETLERVASAPCYPALRGDA